MALNRGLPDPNNAEELLTLIREVFAFLFENQGFRVAHLQDTESERHLVVLTSEAGNLRFLCRRWELEIALGLPTAPPTWSDFVGPSRVWWSFWGLLDDLVSDKREPHMSSRELELALQGVDWRAYALSSVVQKLVFVAPLLKSRVPELFALVHNKPDGSGALEDLL